MCFLRLNYEVSKWLNAALMRTNQSISLQPPTPTGVLRWSDRSSGPNLSLKISISFISNIFSFIAGTELFFFFRFSFTFIFTFSPGSSLGVAAFEVVCVVEKKTKPLPAPPCDMQGGASIINLCQALQPARPLAISEPEQ